MRPTILADHMIPVSDKTRDAIADALLRVRVSTLSYPECHSCEVYLSLDAARVMFVQEWSDADSLSEYLRTETYRRILSLMELADSEPKVRFHYVTKSSGMELVVAACEKDQPVSPDTSA